MDVAMFFYHGVAIHMSHVVGLTSVLKSVGFDSLGSHGCVRLAESDAKQLFEWAPIGTKVIVVKPN